MDLFDAFLAANELSDLLRALAVAAVVFAALWLARWLVQRHLTRLAGRTHNVVDDVAVATLRATRRWAMAAVALWAGAGLLVLPELAREALDTVVVLVLLAQLGLWGTRAIRSYVEAYGERHLEEDAAGVTTVRALGFIGRLLVWTAVALMALENLHIEVAPLLAGLGVGGIAVALAVQNVLGDLFASLSIVLDKPFVVGDFVIVGELAGTVEHVGLKTTRVRSLGGEELIFANSDLLASRIRNFKRMYQRRVVFSVGVTYQTPRETLERIPDMVREAVEALPDVRFDRAHFQKFGPSSLDFETVYYVLVPDYAVYMDRQQAINLELVRRFEAEGIEFAYPTQTLFLAREEG